jgi:hypothetical protein
MKNTAIIISVFTVVVIIMSSFYNDAMSSKQDTCCQTFQIIDRGSGNPVSGCTIVVGCPFVCQCVTDMNGKCQICGFVTGLTYSASATCPNCEGGSINFTACEQVEIIKVDFNCDKK